MTAWGAQCETVDWQAASSADWIAITSGSTGNGNGTVNYSVAANTDCASRVGTLTIAGQTFTVLQDRPYGSHSLDPGNRAHGTIAESGSFTFLSGDNCSWTATSDVDWIHTSSSGAGSGVVEYSVDTNFGVARSGTIHVQEASSVITQAGNIMEILGGVTVITAGDVVLFTPAMIGASDNSSNCLWSFGDGSTSTDCNPSHVFTNCGAFPVSVTVSNGISATSATTSVAVACAMSVTNFQAKLNFARPNLDSCKFKSTPQPGNCTNLTGVVATLDVGGAQVAFTLDAKGRGVSSNGTCRLSYNQKTGACTFSVKLSRGFWRSAWAAYGLGNANYVKPGIAVTLPVILVVGDEAFMAEKPLYYTATAGKSGIAK